MAGNYLAVEAEGAQVFTFALSSHIHFYRARGAMSRRGLDATSWLHSGARNATSRVLLAEAMTGTRLEAVLLDDLATRQVNLLSGEERRLVIIIVVVLLSAQLLRLRVAIAVFVLCLLIELVCLLDIFLLVFLLALLIFLLVIVFVTML
jgi:hypothetical protein